MKKEYQEGERSKFLFIAFLSLFACPCSFSSIPCYTVKINETVTFGEGGDEDILFDDRGDEEGDGSEEEEESDDD